MVGIVIPTVNEASLLPGVLRDVRALQTPHDVVVADGGSTDDTPSVAAREGARVIDVPRGRGPQMNAGADAVRGEWLCFLHADVRMPAEARGALARAVESPQLDAAVWGFRIDASGFWPRLMELGTRWRARVGGLPYGDQGLLVRRSLFEAVGGFPPLPIMEDVAMIQALKARTRLEHLRAPLHVSPRRWQREGPYRTWARNMLLLAAYRLGVPAARLAGWYRVERP